jgi:hypothetical protein
MDDEFFVLDIHSDQPFAYIIKRILEQREWALRRFEKRAKEKAKESRT